jgi:hypothetical protein
VFVETDAEWIERVRLAGRGGPARAARRPARIRRRHPDGARRGTDGDPDLAVYAGEVTTAGRIELLPFLHEQAITITAHIFGNPDGGAKRSSDTAACRMPVCAPPRDGRGRASADHGLATSNNPVPRSTSPRPREDPGYNDFALKPRVAAGRHGG